MAVLVPTPTSGVALGCRIRPRWGRVNRQQKLLRKRVQQEIREEETVRMANLAARTKTTMQEFLRRMERKRQGVAGMGKI